MKEVTLCDMPVRVDDNGLISLTDMHKASGGEDRHRPKFFLQNAQTQRFIDAFPKGGIPPLKTIRGGNVSGTWAHKKLAYKFASWIDPVFEHGVYDVLDRFFAGQLLSPMDELQRFVLECRLSQQLGSFHGKGLNARKREKAKLEQREIELIRRLQLQFPSIEQALIA